MTDDELIEHSSKCGIGGLLDKTSFDRLLTLARKGAAEARAEAKLAKAREALKPFAAEASFISPELSDNRLVRTMHSSDIQVKHLRQAAAAYKETAP